MDEYIGAAQKLVAAQASVRVMTEDEMVSMIASLAANLRIMDNAQPSPKAADVIADDSIDPRVSKKSITDKSITCLCCGKKAKVLNKKHLATHGLTPSQYRAKFKLPKGIPLTCKDLTKSRRDKMNEMRLWERRPRNTDTKA
ncbi:MAG: MucR family transcriptional regulator [Desulfovibrio sp.]|jgi:predicted transcriptional regulator